MSVLAATEDFPNTFILLWIEIVQSVRRIMNMQGTVRVNRSTEHLENCAECYREAMKRIKLLMAEKKAMFILSRMKGM